MDSWIDVRWGEQSEGDDQHIVVADEETRGMAVRNSVPSQAG